MRSSPRKMRSEVGECYGSVPAGVDNLQRLARLPIVELRHQAGQVHNLKNAALLGRGDLIKVLAKHFQTKHGLDMEVEGQPIGDTIHRLKTRIKGSEEGSHGEESGAGNEEGAIVMQHLVMAEEEEQVVPLQREQEGSQRRRLLQNPSQSNRPTQASRRRMRRKEKRGL